jgi:hypothetical protein
MVANSARGTARHYLLRNPVITNNILALSFVIKDT